MNWFTRLISFGSWQHEPLAPQPAQPVPELSCFVKGLIRSMKETPGEWKTSTWDRRWRQHLGVTLTDWGYPWSRQGRIRVVGHELTPVELEALSAAWYAHIEPCIDDELKAMAAKAQAAAQAERAPFEKLGCPDSP